ARAQPPRSPARQRHCPRGLSHQGRPGQLRINPDPARAKALQALADRLITPRIRYSQPGLQSHVTYLYGATNATDQKVGRDAIERYGVLRQQIDALIGELNGVLGPPTDADLQRYVRSGNAS
ncbi:MAG: hypothetical protein M3N39_01595, partial [Pseudomonadota bacterium]|nr:hypothetical protein [Pseudomonadota bacterium]